MSTDKSMIYGVVIFRTDEQHIVVLETKDYDKCVELWKNTYTEWQNSTKELRPFVLIDPVVTAFSPSMIYEIKLMPMLTDEMATKSHNPYQSRMNERGFSRTFPGSGVDLLSNQREF